MDINIIWIISVGYILFMWMCVCLYDAKLWVALCVLSFLYTTNCNAVQHVLVCRGITWEKKDRRWAQLEMVDHWFSAAAGKVCWPLAYFWLFSRCRQANDALKNVYWSPTCVYFIDTPASMRRTDSGRICEIVLII